MNTHTRSTHSVVLEGEYCDCFHRSPPVLITTNFAGSNKERVVSAHSFRRREKKRLPDQTKTRPDQSVGSTEQVLKGGPRRRTTPFFSQTSRPRGDGNSDGDHVFVVVVVWVAVASIGAHERYFPDEVF